MAEQLELLFTEVWHPYRRGTSHKRRIADGFSHVCGWAHTCDQHLRPGNSAASPTTWLLPWRASTPPSGSASPNPIILLFVSLHRWNRAALTLVPWLCPIKGTSVLLSVTVDWWVSCCKGAVQWVSSVRCMRSVWLDHRECALETVCLVKSLCTCCPAWA